VASNVAAAVRDVFALQAQETAAARLAVRVRSTGLTAADVTRACNEERSVVRTWLMRGTLHMVAAADVGWLVDLLRPPVGAPTRRQLELGLDAAVLARGLPVIAEILAARGPLTRAELMDGLGLAGLRLDTTGQAPAHLIVHSARQGIICRGPDREDDEPTYVLLEQWAGSHAKLDREAAMAELARRYLRAHGPAGVADLAYWSGLPLGQVRRGLDTVSPEMERTVVKGATAWSVPGLSARIKEEDGERVRLLPRFDAYLLGYMDRGLVLEERFVKRVQAGGGIIHPTLVVGGRVMGTWRLHRVRAGISVEVAPFEPLAPGAQPGIEAEIADLSRFLGVPAV
jgi:hypothetical protein